MNLKLQEMIILSLPTAKRGLNYISDEGSALILIAMIIGIIVSFFKGAFKTLFAILILGGLFYYFVSSPSQFINGFVELFKLFFG